MYHTISRAGLRERTRSVIKYHITSGVYTRATENPHHRVLMRTIIMSYRVSAGIRTDPSLACADRHRFRPNRHWCAVSYKNYTVFSLGSRSYTKKNKTKFDHIILSHISINTGDIASVQSISAGHPVWFSATSPIADPRRV